MKSLTIHTLVVAVAMALRAPASLACVLRQPFAPDGMEIRSGTRMVDLNELGMVDGH
jgi:hypothetical protein